MSTNWKNVNSLLLMAGGAAVVGASLYYLFKNDDKSSSKRKQKGKKPSDWSRNDILKVLEDISATQERMKRVMKSLTEELKLKKLSFEETYERVKAVQPEDPLDQHGVDIQEFDSILERYQSDEAVSKAITGIMGAPAAFPTISTKAEDVTKEQLISVHRFMLSELQSLVAHFDSLNKQVFDMKTVTIAAQAMVGAKVEEKYELTSDDIECAVLLHHASLKTDSEFARINNEMQSTMAQLMGQSFPSGYPL